jgi:hypothetical protein
MKKGLYTHPMFMDVVMQVLRATPIKGKRYALKVDWWDTHGERLEFRQNLKISNSKAEEFVRHTFGADKRKQPLEAGL